MCEVNVWLVEVSCMFLCFSLFGLNERRGRRSFLLCSPELERSEPLACGGQSCHVRCFKLNTSPTSDRRHDFKSSTVSGEVYIPLF